MRNANDEMRESLGKLDKLGLVFIDIYGSPIFSLLYFVAIFVSLFISKFLSTDGYVELFLIAVVILALKQLIRHQQIQSDIQAEENRLFMGYIASMERSLLQTQEIEIGFVNIGLLEESLKKNDTKKAKKREKAN